MQPFRRRRPSSLSRLSRPVFCSSSRPSSNGPRAPEVQPRQGLHDLHQRRRSIWADAQRGRPRTAHCRPAGRSAPASRREQAQRVATFCSSVAPVRRTMPPLRAWQVSRSSRSVIARTAFRRDNPVRHAERPVRFQIDDGMARASGLHDQLETFGTGGCGGTEMRKPS